MNTFVTQITKNWQTSLAGLIVLVAVLGGQLGLPPNIVHGAEVIATAFGLISAKQQNVTGGTVMQPTPDTILLSKEVEKVVAGVIAPTIQTETAPRS
jgi:hypothetical protein